MRRYVVLVLLVLLALLLRGDSRPQMRPAPYQLTLIRGRKVL